MSLICFITYFAICINQVNTSRGPVIDEAALIEALRERRILGAALDVQEKMPPDLDNPI